jgi:hypothetical protein
MILKRQVFRANKAPAYCSSTTMAMCGRLQPSFSPEKEC